MKKTIAFLYLIVAFCWASCKTEKKTDHTVSEVPEKTDSSMHEKEMDKAEMLVSETIRAHGGDLYDDAFYGITFRGKNYSFRNKKGSFTYTMKSTEDGNEILDVLQNGELTHTINEVESELSQKDIAKYTEDVNSVVYFATLPHKLNDVAVNKVYMGQTNIKKQSYEVLKVTFDPVGGGIDHDDEFMYWINSDTKTMDYLAYSYETNDGGVRYRTAYNPRTVDGIRFQDYINYEAPIGTPLKDMPALHEKGELKELSRIITEDVVNLKNN